MKKIIIIFALFVMAGCGYDKAYLMKDTAFINNDEAGAVVVSVRWDTWSLLSNEMPEIFFRKKGTNDKLLMSGFSRTADSVFSKSGYGFIDYFVLPAGEYEIFGWEIFSSMGFVQWYENPKNEVSIPFVVHPKTVTYLGEIILENHMFKNHDMSERDLAKAYKKYPGLEKAPMIYNQLCCEKGCKVEIETGGKTVLLPVLSMH